MIFHTSHAGFWRKRHAMTHGMSNIPRPIGIWSSLVRPHERSVKAKGRGPRAWAVVRQKTGLTEGMATASAATVLLGALAIAGVGFLAVGSRESDEQVTNASEIFVSGLLATPALTSASPANAWTTPGACTSRTPATTTRRLEIPGAMP